MLRTSLMTTAILLSCYGCSSDEPGNAALDAAVETSDAGTEIDAAVGNVNCTESWCIDQPEEGFQLMSLGREILAGQDVEYCEVVRLPGTAADTYYVNRFEVAMSPGSHHLIVSAVPEGQEAGAQEGDTYQCIGPQLQQGDADLQGMTGSQLPYYDEPFPATVGKVFKGGQLVVFNYHYLNATDSAIHGRSAVNFHTTAEANIEHIAASIGFIRLNIPTAAGETSSHTAACVFTEPAMVFKVARHTHQWGTDVPVYFYDGSDNSRGDLIFTSPSYEDPDHLFAEPVLVQAGEGFEFTCNYMNTTNGTLNFGLKATDEMCILVGSIYSPTGRTMNNQTCIVTSAPR